MPSLLPFCQRSIVATQPKSVLCTPLLHQGKLSGILYLENNLTAGAFTDDRLDVLKLLFSQAVISIENAKLYKKLALKNAALQQVKDELGESNRALEQKIQERTQELLQTLDILKATQAELMIENALLRSAEQSSIYELLSWGKSTNGCRDLCGTAGRPIPLQSFKAWRVLLHPEYTADGQI